MEWINWIIAAIILFIICIFNFILILNFINKLLYYFTLVIAFIVGFPVFMIILIVLYGLVVSMAE